MKTSIKYYVLCIMGILFSVLSILHTTSYILPAYAQVNIREHFGFGDIQTLGVGTSKLVPAAFSVAASLVVLYFLWGAYKYLTSRGDKEEVQNARNMITHAIIGFIILIFTFFVLQFILFKLFGANDFSPI